MGLHHRLRHRPRRPLQGLQVDGKPGGQLCAQNKGKQFPCDEQAVKTAYWTLQQLASTVDGQLKFYWQPTAGELETIFERVALDLTQVRLIDDDTT